MLITAKTLKGFTLRSIDGEIGKMEEFYFDDRHWTIRYLVAATGHWLAGKQVLISPYALGAVHGKEHQIDVALTKKQIEESPGLDSDKPVSRQFEESYYGYYGWPGYWAGPYSWGCYPYIERDRTKWEKPAHDKESWDPHLRSTHDVSGRNLQATDGEIGHVEDFIIDDETWAIRYFIINTRNWWPGRKILVSPQWIERVSWGESKVFVNLTREVIKQSPEYKDDSLPTRDFETKLYQHYDRQGYWTGEPTVNQVHPTRK